MKKLYLIRGLSGSGKSTLGKDLGELALSADDFFCHRPDLPDLWPPDETYRFDASKLSEAHQYCQERVLTALDSRQATVVVANTFSCRWELQPYFDLARKYGYRVTVIDLFDGGLTDEELADPKRNPHGVPVETIRAMRERWEHDWKSGNPTPPWER